LLCLCGCARGLEYHLRPRSRIRQGGRYTAVVRSLCTIPTGARSDPSTSSRARPSRPAPALRPAAPMTEPSTSIPLDELRESISDLRREVGRRVVGQDRVVEEVLLCLLAG